MRFEGLGLDGAFLVKIERASDDRGFFARTYCAEEFRRAGIAWQVVQSSISFNTRRSTVRGMHFQYPPRAESKLVRCTRGAILDIIVDLRPESPTYLQHFAVELSADNYRSIYVPERFAHGYQALEDNTETSYQVGEFYAPGFESGLLYSDERLGLEWPLPVSEISPKDAAWKPLSEIESGVRRRMSI